jgi:hypothetical protein
VARRISRPATSAEAAELTEVQLSFPEYSTAFENGCRPSVLRHHDLSDFFLTLTVANQSGPPVQPDRGLVAYRASGRSGQIESVLRIETSRVFPDRRLQAVSGAPANPGHSFHACRRFPCRF